MNLRKQATHPATSYRRIPLTQGQFALVDASDFEWLNQWKWHASRQADGAFYAVRNSPKIKGKRTAPKILMHRLILDLSINDPRLADHKNPSMTLDNRRQNLRVATASQSCANQRIRKDSTTGIKGVSFYQRTGKWAAGIRKHGKRIHLGYFDSVEQASAAYATAALSIFGDFHRTR